MSRIIVATACIAVWCLAGCEGAPGQSPPGANLYALTAEEQQPDAEQETDDDRPDKRFGMSWARADEGIVASDKMTVEVENLEDTPAKIEVKMVVDGLLNKTADVDLGSHDIDGRETLSLSVDASDIPIQTSTGVCLARAYVSRIIESPYGPREAVEISPARYYRHDPSFETLRHFSEKEFEMQFGGRFAGNVALTFDKKGALERGAVIGRRLTTNGVFAEVDLATDESHAFEQEGKVVGYHVGAGVVVGTEDLE